MLDWVNQTWLRLKTPGKRGQLDRELDDARAFHLAMREHKNAVPGLTPDESRYAATHVRQPHDPEIKDARDGFRCGGTSLKPGRALRHD